MVRRLVSETQKRRLASQLLPRLASSAILREWKKFIGESFRPNAALMISKQLLKTKTLAFGTSYTSLTSFIKITESEHRLSS